MSLDPKCRLLLLSSSHTSATAYLEHACHYLRGLLGGKVRRVLFIPYARVDGDYAGYLARTRPAFKAAGCELAGIHDCAAPAQAIAEAEALAVGGGNTFLLLHELYTRGLLRRLRQRIVHGVPYVGWSAGTNLACSTIRTTNDMPVIWPRRCQALALVPFQINPHYIDAHPPGHTGETRAERLTEFTLLNPHTPVVGLREGSALQVEDGRIRLLGRKSARIFCGGRAWNVAPRESLQFLLEQAA